LTVGGQQQIARIGSLKNSQYKNSRSFGLISFHWREQMSHLCHDAAGDEEEERDRFILKNSAQQVSEPRSSRQRQPASQQESNKQATG
jgi:hypothetical protein